MNWFQKILQALGLASNSDESGVALPVVTVKIVDSLSLGLSQGDTLTLSQLVAKVGASDTDTLVKNIASALFSGAVFSRMLEPMSPADVDAFVHEAQANDPTYEPVNFNNFLEIVCSRGFDTDPLVEALKAWTGVVEFAGRNPEVRGASVTHPEQNQYYTKQGYLLPTKGVNAKAAWDQGADGTGTHIVDVEAGWFLQHEDLPTGIQLLHGIINPAVIDHGTAVLGILVAQDNTKGIIGLAPNARVDLSSVNESKGKVEVVKAIIEADKALSRGDVMVIPLGPYIKQPDKIDRQLPADAYYPFRVTIRAVVARGKVVVEGAGNDAVDLDNCIDSQGKHIFDQNNTTEFKDSGAIIVAAGTADQHPSRRTTPQGGTSYGHRIDCCAHGEKVVTCDFDDSHPKRTNVYRGIGGRPDFSGTSAAAPIVAGCCLLIQHLQALLKPNDGKLNPAQMRDLLRDPNNCNASHDPTDLIGGMPVFDKILHNVFQQP